ncbi:von Ebner gland protein 1 [Lemmus lemmus]
MKATASDKEIPGLELKSMSVTPMTITTLEGGNLQVKFTVLIAAQCEEMNIVLEKTDEPKKYTAYGGTQALYIIPSAVEDHYIFYCIGRDPDVHQEALEDFQNAVRARGLKAESILIPRQSGRKQAAMLSRPMLRRQSVT